MSADEYTRAMKYEMLIRNAFKCPRGSRNGAELSYMQNAMTMEHGETYAKHLGSFEKQFEKVKTYISKALIKLTKTKPYSNESKFFDNLHSRLAYSETTEELMRIVDSRLEKLKAIKKL